jgi:hypothetical protein
MMHYWLTCHGTQRSLEPSAEGDCARGDTQMTDKTRARSVKHILREIDCQHLALHKGEGYWYFEYDDPANNIFETLSVYVARLSDLSLDGWISDGCSLVAKVEAQRAGG